MATNGPSPLQDKAYELRLGINALGTEYEFKTMALFALRCVAEEVADMWMVSNAARVGDFDDIILQVQRRGGQKVTYMFQLKHQDKPRPIAEKEYFEEKGDYSLSKYCKSIADLKKRMSVREKGLVQDLGKFRSISFVIFTNKGVKHHAFLGSALREDLSLWNTHNSNDKIYKFRADKLPKGCSDFCDNIYLFCDQVHVQLLNEQIEQEIRKIVQKFELTQVETKNTTKAFVTYITSWAKGELGGSYFLTKQDVVATLSELFLRPYMMNLKKVQFSFHKCNQKAIWNEIMLDKSVTIVDADAIVTSFLKSYIGSAVRRYHMEETWNCDLSPDAQTALYEKSPSLKRVMLKTVGQHSKINLLHIYKFLWSTKEIPLLLEARDKDDCNNILKIHKMTNYGLKIVILDHTNRAPLKNSFSTLNDLHEDQRSKILQQCVQLQGRSPIKLEELVDETMYEHIRCQDIIHILSGSCTIGNEHPPLMKCFIPRNLLPILVSFTVFREVQTELFVITTHLPRYKLKAKLEKKSHYRRLCTNALIVKEEELQDKLAEIERLKEGKKGVHYLNFAGQDWLQWKKSQGKVACILRHQLTSKECPDMDLEPDFLSNQMLNRTHIIAGAPGMGKSTLLNYLAVEAPPTLWVIKVVLNQHAGYYQDPKTATLTASQHLNYFQDKLNSQLAKNVFEKLVKERKVLVLLDGLDEVAGDNQAVVVAIARILQDAGHTIWITTRPHLKPELEETLSTIATALNPFTKLDQKTFLVNYFSRSVGSNLEPLQPLTEDFVDELLRAAKANMYDWGQQFMEIPLQCRLLAEVFKDQYETSLKEGRTVLKRNFDLLYLYEEFLRMKIEILCRKFGGYAREMRFFFEKYQKLFALTVVFGKHVVLRRLLDAHLEECYRSERRIMPLLQREGVVMLERNNSGVDQIFSINFVHRTFAEYLSAQWLFENFSNKDEETRTAVKDIIRKERIVSDYKFLFKIFDCFLARDCPLLKNVINERLDEAIHLIRRDPGQIDALDKGGRTVLHVAALCGLCHSRPYRNLINKKDKVLDVIKNIPESKIRSFVHIKDDLLEYTPLDYAIEVGKSFAVANELCKHLQSINPRVDLTSRSGFKVNTRYCFNLNYYNLFPVFLANFIYGQILQKHQNKDRRIYPYVAEYTNQTPALTTKYVQQLGVTTMAELFQFVYLKNPSVKGDYYYNLCCASAFGSKQNLLYLLQQGGRVNEADAYGNIPLHYAAFHDHCSSLQILLSQDSDFNKRNRTGDTPLLLAVKSQSMNATDLLLEKGADVNLQNDNGESPTYCATVAMNLDILTKLLRANPNLNAQHKSGSTPLHVAVKHRNIRCQKDIEYCILIVNFLLANGADTNIQDNCGNTPLHCIAKATHNPFKRDFNLRGVGLLLKKGANLLIKNVDGKTARDLALEQELLH